MCVSAYGLQQHANRFCSNVAVGPVDDELIEAIEVEDLTDQEEEEEVGPMLSEGEKLLLLSASDMPLLQLSLTLRGLMSKVSTHIMNAIIAAKNGDRRTRSNNGPAATASVDMVLALQRLPGVISLAKRLRKNKRSNKEIEELLQSFLPPIACPWERINRYYLNNLYILRDMRV